MNELINRMLSDWTTTVQLGAGLAGIIFIVVVAIVTKLAWGKIIVSALAAAFVVWVVNSGLGLISGKIGEDVNAAAPAIVEISAQAPADLDALVI